MGTDNRVEMQRVYVKAFSRLYSNVSTHVDARMDATNGCSTLGSGPAQGREGSARGEGARRNIHRATYDRR